MKEQKFTKKDFDAKYPNDDVCLDRIFKGKYGNTPFECPDCGKITKFHRVKGRKCYSCQFCGYQIHPLTGTIFHKSSTPLTDWFYAIYLFSQSKNGVAAKELERQLGVTYKCAWRMAKQIRLLLNQKKAPLTGTVEIDETYVGGKEGNKHWDKKAKNNGQEWTDKKTMVIGAVSREEKRITATIIEKIDNSNVQPFIRKNIDIEAHINTDEATVYSDLKWEGYKHSVVNHGKKNWKKGKAHTNTIEGFWSQLKCSIHGTFHNVSPKYLQHYIDEFAYRYNNRKLKPVEIFTDLMLKVEMQGR